MRIAVLGDGGWGTALAILLVGNGHNVTLWGPFPDYLDQMTRERANSRFLPGVPLPAGLAFASEVAVAVEGAELIVLATPVPYMRAMLGKLAATGAAQRAGLINVAKGIEIGSLLRPQELGRELLGLTRWATLSGPSHAEEVARGIPTAVVAASTDAHLAIAVQAAFMGGFFRVYTSPDVVGVELGGALKNIFAVAAGICDGMGFGDNSKAALMTRGIAEMARLGEALGGSAQTFAGLSGVGDLIVTCISRHSRNRHVGEELGRGGALPEIQKAMGLSVAEGVKTVVSAHELAGRLNVSTPIIGEVYTTLYEGKDPKQAARDLMTRAARPE